MTNKEETTDALPAAVRDKRAELMPGEIKAAIQRAAAKVIRGNGPKGYVIDDMARWIAEAAADALDEDRRANARTYRESPALVARLLAKPTDEAPPKGEQS